MNKKTGFVVSAILFLLVFLIHADAQAADKFPSKPITVVIPVEAGGDMDIVARFLMKKASTLLNVPLVAVNKPGAGFTIAYREVYKAKPDGYTIGFANSTIITSKMQGFFSYNYKDFSHLGFIHPSYPILLASTKTKRPFKTFAEVASFAKSHPEEVSLAVSAVGGVQWSAGVLLGLDTGLKFNVVPQEGSAAFVITQLAGGHVDLGVTAGFAAKPQIEAGNVRPLAVFGEKRLVGNLENTPTLKELGYPIVVNTFATIIGPPNMPPATSEILVKALKESITDPESEKFLLSKGERSGYMAPQQFLKFCEDQEILYRKIYGKAGILKEK